MLFKAEPDIIYKKDAKNNYIFRTASNGFNREAKFDFAFEIKLLLGPNRTVSEKGVKELFQCEFKKGQNITPSL